MCVITMYSGNAHFGSKGEESVFRANNSFRAWAHRLIGSIMLWFSTRAEPASPLTLDKLPFGRTPLQLLGSRVDYLKTVKMPIELTRQRMRHVEWNPSILHDSLTQFLFSSLTHCTHLLRFLFSIISALIICIMCSKKTAKVLWKRNFCWLRYFLLLLSIFTPYLSGVFFPADSL